MRSPNWKNEELKLALELYLSKNLSWLSKMNDDTEEIKALSQLLNQLDLFDTHVPKEFRSCSSVRMKLSNFKSLDSRYKKSSLSNVGSSDRDIWIKYQGRYNTLRKECKTIIKKHLKGDKSDMLNRYLARFDVGGAIPLNKPDFFSFAKETYNLAEQYRNEILTEDDDLQQIQKIVNSCFGVMKALKWCVKDKGKKQEKTVSAQGTIDEHGGINQRPVGNEKIGEHVQNSFGELVANKMITSSLLSNFMDARWSKEHFHLGHPFAVKIDNKKDLDDQLRDSNGYIRYWKKIYTIQRNKYCICKEWYERQRKYYDRWLNAFLNNGLRGISTDELLKLIHFIKEEDEAKVSIPKEDIIKQINLPKPNKIVDNLVEMGLLARFEGKDDEYVIEDYELLHDIINHPQKFI